MSNDKNSANPRIGRVTYSTYVYVYMNVNKLETCAKFTLNIEIFLLTLVPLVDYSNSNQRRMNISTTGCYHVLLQLHYITC